MSFSLDMSAFVKKAGKNADQVVRKTATDLFIAVLEDTPVDTGRARGNWQMSLDAPIETALVNTRSVSEVKSEIIRDAVRYKAGQTLYFSNNLAYIQALEMGHSKQSPPHAMVRLNVMRFQTFVNKAVLAIK